MPITANPTVVGVPANYLVGVAQVYLAPFGTAGPALTVAYGGTWPAGWLATGYTETGLTVNMNRKVNSLYVEELSEPIATVVDTNDPTLDVTFAEDTLQSMAWAYGGGTITQTAAATPDPAYATLVLAENLEQLAMGFEGSAPDGNFRRVIIPQVVSAGKAKTQYQRAKAGRMYPATFNSIGPLSNWIIQEIGSGVEAQ